MKTHIERWAEAKEVRDTITSFLEWFTEKHGLALVQKDELDPTLAQYLGVDLEGRKRELKLMDLGRASVNAKAPQEKPQGIAALVDSGKLGPAGAVALAAAASLGEPYKTMARQAAQYEADQMAQMAHQQATGATEKPQEGQQATNPYHPAHHQQPAPQGTLITYRGKPFGTLFKEYKTLLTGGPSRLMIYRRRQVIGLPLAIWQGLVDKGVIWLGVTCQDEGSRFLVDLATAQEKGIPYDEGLGQRWGIPLALFEVLDSHTGEVIRGPRDGKWDRTAAFPRFLFDVRQGNAVKTPGRRSRR
jgi:hypothetical protein